MGPQPPCWSTSGPWLLPAIAAEKLPGAQTMTSSLGSAAPCMANLRGAVVTQQYLGSHPYCHTRAFHFTSYCQLLQKLQGMENKRGEVSDSEALGSNAVLLKMDLLTTLDQQILQFIFVVLIFMPILTLKYGRGGIWDGEEWSHPMALDSPRSYLQADLWDPAVSGPDNCDKASIKTEWGI